MRRRALVIGLALACLGAGTASGGKSGNAKSAGDVTGSLSPSGGGGGHGGGSVGAGRSLVVDPRHAPPLDPQRKVSEQDCTKPVDDARGNLKCK
jgi:hypothetical protein